MSARELLIVAPVLGRPENAQRVAESVRDATHVEHRLLFICSRGDEPEIEAVKRTGAQWIVVPWTPGRGDYARKVNLGFSRGREPWIFQAADDLRFEPGWDVAALEVAERMQAAVVGTNDDGNPRVKRGLASTHSLIRRSYVEEQGAEWGKVGSVMHEGYWHNFCDEELVDLARSRSVFAFARRSIVEHLHPHWGKADDGPTYRLGQQRFHLDQRLFAQRARQWRRRTSSRRPTRVP